MTPPTLREIVRNAGARTEEMHALIRRASEVVRASDRKITLRDLGYGWPSTDAAEVPDRRLDDERVGDSTTPISRGASPHIGQ